MERKSLNKIVEGIDKQAKTAIEEVVEAIKFTKNFRSHTAEEWYIFIPGFNDPHSGGAAGKAIIHYNLLGNKDIFINTTIILDDPEFFDPKLHTLVYAICDEAVNRLVGYADTLLSVHSGSNSYQAEYKS